QGHGGAALLVDSSGAAGVAAGGRGVQKARLRGGQEVAKDAGAVKAGTANLHQDRMALLVNQYVHGGVAGHLLGEQAGVQVLPKADADALAGADVVGQAAGAVHVGQDAAVDGHGGAAVGAVDEHAAAAQVDVHGAVVAIVGAGEHPDAALGEVGGHHDARADGEVAHVLVASLAQHGRIKGAAAPHSMTRHPQLLPSLCLLCLIIVVLTPSVRPAEQKASQLHHSFVEEQPSGTKCFQKSKIDRESLCSEVGACCPEAPDCKLSLSIIVFDKSQPGKVREIVRLDLRVVDLNDNAPRWNSPRLSLEVPEHSPVGSRFQLPVAMDPDKAPENATQRYELVSGLDKFQLGYLLADPAGRQAGSLWLEIRADLDREVAAWHQAELVAVDGGHPAALTGSLTVNISVSDINDNPPRFGRFPRLVKVAENSPLSRELLRLNATDADDSDMERLRFRLGVSASQSVAEMFRVDKRTGSVWAMRTLDYEERKSYDIPVTVTDGKHSADASVRIEVVNENDNPPKITLVSFGGGGGGSSSGNFELAENAAFGTTVASLDVFDADDKEESLSVACYVEPPTEFGILPLYKSAKRNFLVVSNRAFDREQTPSFTVRISCNDNGTPNRVDSVVMRIDIRDENDNTPEFLQNPLFVLLPENKDPLPAFVLAKMEARDADSGDNAELRYSLDAASSRHFDIDRGTAAIWARRSFDRELEQQFNLTVFATDLGDLPDVEGRRRTATGTVVVNIEDVNDCPPEFSASHYAFAVEENAELTRYLGNVTASDCDAEERHRRVVYRMLGGPSGPDSQLAFNYFRVTQDGRVYTGSQPIDREFRESFTFLVLADDQAGRRQTAHVTVSILDINDNSPQWVFPSSDTQQVNVSVQQPIGRPVARLRTKDPDYGPNGSVVYSLESHQPPTRLFSVTPEGEILLSGQINPARDLGQFVRLRIVAADRGQPPRSSWANLTIRIVERAPDEGGGGFFGSSPRTADGNLAIILAMVVVTVIVSIFLIAAIVFLRCRTAGGAAGAAGRAAGHDRGPGGCCPAPPRRGWSNRRRAPPGRQPAYQQRRHRRRRLAGRPARSAAAATRPALRLAAAATADWAGRTTSCWP
uniref:Cadherin domain-containing protein n=1 Tax=Macrostomum lignano TaxID=282301 RepID=A0A1I8IPY5_9PLAT